MRAEKKPMLKSFTVLFLLLFVAAIVPSVFAEGVSDDLSALRKEVEALRKQSQQYQDLNSKLEDRIGQLEKKLNSLQVQAPMSLTSPQALPQPPALPEPKEGVLTRQPGKLVVANLTEKDINQIVKGFEFGGYFRAGSGFNARGGHMEAFQAPLAPAKYRLGNESDTYLEAILAQNNWNPDPDGVSFRTQIRLSYQTQQNKSEDNTNSVCLREMYAQMGNFITSNPELKVWAGERFYRLPELDINDFWWYDLSGYGGGFENIKFFDVGKLDVAYLSYSDKDITISTKQGRIQKENVNFILKDVVVPGGKGTFWVNGGFIKGGTWEGINYPSVGGADLGFMHNTQGDRNNNQFSFQAGYGACTSLSTGGNIPTATKDLNSWTVRLTDMLNRKVNDRLDMQLVGVYQYTDTGYAAQAKQVWGSLGIRPVIGITKHLALELEPGIDYINSPRNDYDTYLFKFTTALRLAPDDAVSGHPRFRLYATYAKWGNDFRGNAIGGEGYRDKTDGLNFGVQGEHWW